MRSIPVAYILWFFLGLLGVHRFYCNRVLSGLLWLVTLGLFGIGWLVDLFIIPGMVRNANAEARLRQGLYHVPVYDLPQARPVEGATRRLAPTAGYRVLYCTDCGSPMQVPVQDVGRHFACPRCHHVMVAPG